MFKQFDVEELLKSYKEELGVRREEERNRWATAVKGVGVIEPPAGDYALRIIPPLANDELARGFTFPARLHFLTGQYYVCPASFEQGVKCPVCEMFFNLRKSNPTLSKELNATPRHLVWAWPVPIKQGNPELSIKLFVMPVVLLRALLDQLRDPMTGQPRDFLSPDRGMLVYFAREGEGLGTRHVFKGFGPPLPVPEEVLKQVKKFSEVVIRPSEDELRSSLERHLRFLERRRKVSPQPPQSSPEYATTPSPPGSERVPIEEDVPLAEKQEGQVDVSTPGLNSPGGVDVMELLRQLKGGE